MALMASTVSTQRPTVTNEMLGQDLPIYSRFYTDGTTGSTFWHRRNENAGYRKPLLRFRFPPVEGKVSHLPPSGIPSRRGISRSRYESDPVPAHGERYD